MAHERRIIHRDLSPDNIILRGGVPSEAVIIDFGIAKDANPGAQTIVGNEFAGKYAYAAPEQLSGHTDARSDLYALGALLLATFRGKRPDIGANPMEVLKNKALPLDTSGVPEPLKSLIDKMTQPDPAQRYQSADDLLAAIDHGDDSDRTVIAPRPTTVVPPRSCCCQTRSREACCGHTTCPGRQRTWRSHGRSSGRRSGPRRGRRLFHGRVRQFARPDLALADPYVLTIEKPASGPVTAKGNVPSEATSTTLTKAVLAMPPYPYKNSLPPSPTYPKLRSRVG